MYTLPQVLAPTLAFYDVTAAVEQSSTEMITLMRERMTQMTQAVLQNRIPSFCPSDAWWDRAVRRRAHGCLYSCS